MNNDYIVIGKIGAPYGIQGWLKIVSFTELTTDILGFTPWLLEDNNGFKKIDILDGHPHGKGVVVKFTDYDTPESARLLTGQKIYIQRSQLPQLQSGEYYWSDLEGLTVINHDGTMLGKIAYLMETGANDVMMVKGNKELVIPYLLNEVVTYIDLKNQVMHVDWDFA